MASAFILGAAHGALQNDYVVNKTNLFGGKLFLKLKSRLCTLQSSAQRRARISIDYCVLTNRT